MTTSSSTQAASRVWIGEATIDQRVVARNKQIDKLTLERAGYAHPDARLFQQMPEGTFVVSFTKDGITCNDNRTHSIDGKRTIGEIRAEVAKLSDERLFGVAPTKDPKSRIKHAIESYREQPYHLPVETDPNRVHRINRAMNYEMDRRAVGRDPFQLMTLQRDVMLDFETYEYRLDYPQFSLHAGLDYLMKVKSENPRKWGELIEIEHVNFLTLVAAGCKPDANVKILQINEDAEWIIMRKDENGKWVEFQPDNGMSVEDIRKKVNIEYWDLRKDKHNIVALEREMDRCGYEWRLQDIFQPRLPAGF